MSQMVIFLPFSIMHLTISPFPTGAKTSAKALNAILNVIRSRNAPILKNRFAFFFIGTSNIDAMKAIGMRCFAACLR